MNHRYLKGITGGHIKSVRTGIAILMVVGVIGLWLHFRDASCASMLRTMYYGDDFRNAVGQGSGCVDRTSSARTRAWYILNMARAGRAADALQAASSPVDLARPEGQFALAGALLFEPDDATRALRAARSALESDPLDIDYVWLVADILRLQGRFDEALRILRRADPSNRSAILQSEMATVYLDVARRGGSSGPVEKARLRVERAGSIEPGFIRPRYVLARYYMDAGRPAEAYRELAAIADQATSLGIHAMLWDATQMRSDLPSELKIALIIKDYRRFVAEHGSSSTAMNQLSYPIREIGRIDIADQIQRKMASSFPDSLEAIQVQYWLLKDGISRDEALGALSPGNRRVYIARLMSFSRKTNAKGSMVQLNSLADALRLASQTPGPAASALTRSIAVELAAAGPQDPISLLAAAGALNKLESHGNEARAIATTGLASLPAYRRRSGWRTPSELAAQETPLRVSLLNARAYASLRLGEIGRARLDLDEAVRLGTTTAETWRNAGLLHRASGSGLAARDAFKRCAALDQGFHDQCFAAAAASSDGRSNRDERALAVEIAAIRGRALLEARLRGARSLVVAGRSFDGAAVSIPNVRSRIKVLTFWGVWCVVCKAQIPRQIAMAQEWSDDPRVEFVMVNDGKFASNSRRWLAQTGYRSNALVAPDMFKIAEVSVVPTTLILDDRGAIVYRMEGLKPSMEIEQKARIETLLKS